MLGGTPWPLGCRECAPVSAHGAGVHWERAQQALATLTCVQRLTMSVTM
jgi:hypothetical protein